MSCQANVYARQPPVGCGDHRCLPSCRESLIVRVDVRAAADRKTPFPSSGCRNASYSPRSHEMSPTTTARRQCEQWRCLRASSHAKSSDARFEIESICAPNERKINSASTALLCRATRANVRSRRYRQENGHEAIGSETRLSVYVRSRTLNEVQRRARHARTTFVPARSRTRTNVHRAFIAAHD